MTGPGEPAAGPWRPIGLERLASDLAGPGPGRAVVAVDGRSGAGKSTLTRRLQAVIPHAHGLAADDMAWHAPMFGWFDLLIEGVLNPFRAGDPVHFRPPAWEQRGRPGAIDVPVGTRVLVVEGVGCSARQLSDHIDSAVWVQSDYAEAERQGIARDVASGVNGDEAASTAFWHAWMAREDPFLAADRPWERATVIVAGTGLAPANPTSVLLSTSVRESAR